MKVTNIYYKNSNETGQTSGKASTKTLPSFLKYGRSKMKIHFENINAFVKELGYI